MGDTVAAQLVGHEPHGFLSLTLHDPATLQTSASLVFYPLRSNGHTRHTPHTDG